MAGVVCTLLMSALLSACGGAEQQNAGPVGGQDNTARDSLSARGDLPLLMRQPVPVSDAVQDSVFDAAARAAWAFVERQRVASTGLIAAQPDWAYPTIWDLGSALGAIHSARQLGYIDDAGYRSRVQPLLETLESVRLYDGVAYGRNYAAETGELVDESGKVSRNGTGYSALDLGRLLVWLKIVAETDPELADAAQAVAERIDQERVLDEGYMYGEQIMRPGEAAERYQEGRLGYEQYAAQGFELWGMEAEEAAELGENLQEATVLGRPVAGDRRGLDRLTSEPFVLLGMELGFDNGMRRVAEQTLAAQAERHAQSGQITIVSEDALAVEPHYFYYYCVYCDGEPFVINVHTPGLQLDAPRWVSTKAAFGWHALMPSAYTWQAVEHVQGAYDPKAGWASGVFEETGASTETYTLNTAGVILEAAAYRRLQQSFYGASTGR